MSCLAVLLEPRSTVCRLAYKVNSTPCRSFLLFTLTLSARSEKNPTVARSVSYVVTRLGKLASYCFFCSVVFSPMFQVPRMRAAIFENVPATDRQPTSCIKKSSKYFFFLLFFFFLLWPTSEVRLNNKWRGDRIERKTSFYVDGKWAIKNVAVRWRRRVDGGRRWVDMARKSLVKCEWILRTQALTFFSRCSSAVCESILARWGWKSI